MRNFNRRDIKLGAVITGVTALMGTFAGLGVALLTNDQGLDKIAHFFKCCYTLVDSCKNLPELVVCGAGEYEGVSLAIVFECLQELSPENVADLCKQALAYDTGVYLGYGAAAGAGAGLIVVGAAAAVKFFKNREQAETVTEGSALIQRPN